MTARSGAPHCARAARAAPRADAVSSVVVARGQELREESVLHQPDFHDLCGDLEAIGKTAEELRPHRMVLDSAGIEPAIGEKSHCAFELAPQRASWREYQASEAVRLALEPPVFLSDLLLRSFPACNARDRHTLIKFAVKPIVPRFVRQAEVIARERVAHGSLVDEESISIAREEGVNVDLRAETIDGG